MRRSLKHAFWTGIAAAVLAAVLAAGTTTAARADEPPVIDLWTMGPSPEVFQMFGHSAICVTDAGHPDGVCYNYGTTEFDRPSTVIWNFLRGQSRFWVSTTSLDSMFEFYAGLDRTLYRQRLPLTDEQARALAARLERDLAPDRRYYNYNHFFDNCSTRLRDHIDAVTGGKLRAGTDIKYGPSFRELSLRGFSQVLGLLIGSDVLLGRVGDQHPTVYQAMYLPDVLRVEVERRLGVAPVIENVRQAPLPTHNPHSGRWALLGGALGLGLIAGATAFSRRRVVRRLGLALVGLVLGACGAVLDGLAIVSALPELRVNEQLLVFVATDLALIFLWGRALRWYVRVRLGMLAAVALGAVVGIFIEPVWAPIAVIALPLGCVAAADVLARRRATVEAKAPEPAQAAAPIVE